MRKPSRVGDENAVARMLGAAVARWRQSGRLEGGHDVPMSLRPRRQAHQDGMEFAGHSLILAAFAPCRGKSQLGKALIL